LLSLWTFLAVSYDELNALTFSESLVTSALDGAEMCKYVCTAFALDEAEALAFVKPLYSSSNLV
jgi:hypothetical protein